MMGLGSTVMALLLPARWVPEEGTTVHSLDDTSHAIPGSHPILLHGPMPGLASYAIQIYMMPLNPAGTLRLGCESILQDLTDTTVLL